METGKGAPVESIIVSIVVVVVGWIAAGLAYTFDQGKRQGRQNERLDAIAKQLDADRAAYRESLLEVRKDFNTALSRLDAMFLDHNGNPRLMSVDAHRSWCAQSHEVCGERFSRIVEGLSKGETDRLQRDNEIFNRLRKIERVTDRMAAKMDIKEES
jgi:hypothetical protein